MNPEVARIDEIIEELNEGIEGLTSSRSTYIHPHFDIIPPVMGIDELIDGFNKRIDLLLTARAEILGSG